VNEECPCEDTPKKKGKKKETVEVMPEIPVKVGDDYDKKTSKYISKSKV